MSRNKRRSVLVKPVSPTRSKTVWFNVASIITVLSILALVLVDPAVLAIIPAAYLPLVGAVVAAINIVLRYNTVAPLTVHPMVGAQGVEPDE